MRSRHYQEPETSWTATSVAEWDVTERMQPFGSFTMEEKYNGGTQRTERLYKENTELKWE